MIDCKNTIKMVIRILMRKKHKGNIENNVFVWHVEMRRNMTTFFMYNESFDVNGFDIETLYMLNMLKNKNDTYSFSFYLITFIEFNLFNSNQSSSVCHATKHSSIGSFINHRTFSPAM